MIDESEQTGSDGIQDHAIRLKRLLDWLIIRKVDGRLEARLDREAIVQETLRKALEGMPKSPEPIRDLRSWLNRILVHNLTDEIRRVAGARGLSPDLRAASSESVARLEELLVADHTSPSRRAIRNEEERRLAEAIERLSEAEREVVRLCKLTVPPWSHAEVAQRLGRSVPAVRGLLARAIRKLHDDLTG